MNISPDMLIEISFHNIDHSSAVESKIRERIEGLQKYFSPIIRCHVVVEERHRHHNSGNSYQVHIEVNVPGHEIVANRLQDANHTYQDIFVSVRDAFDSIEKKLMALSDRKKGKVKHHEIWTVPFE